MRIVATTETTLVECDACHRRELCTGPPPEPGTLTFCTGCRRMFERLGLLHGWRAVEERVPFGPASPELI